MNQSLSSFARYALEVAWRRRNLLVLPLMVLLPLGIVYAYLAPRTYVAKSLLLLQETSRDYPLARDMSGGARMQDRIVGLQALLKSDRVLVRVMGDIADPEVVNDPRRSAAWIKGFSKSLSLDLVGNHFLELSLKDSDPVGLGRQLEVVTSRFLEALLSSQDALSATQVLVANKKSKVDEAERSYRQALEQSSGVPKFDRQAEESQIEAMVQKLADKAREKAEAAALLEAAPKSTVGSGANAGDKSSPNEPESATQAGAAADKKSVDDRIATLSTEIATIERSIETARRQLEASAASEKRLAGLRAEIAKAREAYDDYARRYITPAESRTPGILNAPERIKLIDPPRDPDLPETTALKLALVAILLSLLTAVGLVVLAELLDPRLRRRDQIAEITGAPVLARLPAA